MRGSARLRVACVDIGSNTTRLLVADGGEGGALRPVLGDRVFTRGRPVADIAPVVSRLAGAARDAGAVAVRAVGTASLRAAGADAVEELRTRSGVEVELLDPGAEARLAFAGAARHREEPGTIAVLDVGGGSTELALGTVADGARTWSSVPVGSSVLTDAHLADDPPGVAQLAAAELHAREALRELACDEPVEAALAAGGSATTLGRLLGSQLTPVRLDTVLDELLGAPSAEVARRHGIDPERARLLPAGLLLLRAAGEVLGVRLRLGAGGLREGVCLDLLAQMR